MFWTAMLSFQAPPSWASGPTSAQTSNLMLALWALCWDSCCEAPACSWRFWLAQECPGIALQGFGQVLTRIRPKHWSKPSAHPSYVYHIRMYTTYVFIPHSCVYHIRIYTTFVCIPHTYVYHIRMYHMIREPIASRQPSLLKPDTSSAGTSSV